MVWIASDGNYTKPGHVEAYSEDTVVFIGLFERKPLETICSISCGSDSSVSQVA